MSTFIKQAACSGHRPVHLGQTRYIQRADLVAQLLRKRKSARFVFAPSGYGKTALAADYCETVFSYAHVFWIRATSPCFIRDLDAGTIAQLVFEQDNEAALVVFDDMLRLDGERVALLAEQIESLLARNCEVLVLGTPSSADCCSLNGDRMVLHAGDLLLSDREMSYAFGPAGVRAGGPLARQIDHGGRSAGGAPSAAASGVSAAQIAHRIPALAWSSAPEDLAGFLANLFQEDFTPAMAATIAHMMVVGAGKAPGALEGALPNGNVVSRLAQDYPHLGVDEGTDRYDCSIFPLEDVAAAAKQLLSRIVLATSYETRGEMVSAWADEAFEMGVRDRACDIVRLLAPRKMRSEWAIRHARGLVHAGVFLPAKRLVDAADEDSQANRGWLTVLDVACRLRLEDGLSAVAHAKRLAFTATVDVGARLLLLAVLVRYAESSIAQRALTEMTLILDNAPDAQLAARPFSVLMARGAKALFEGPEHLAQLIEYECRAEDGRDDDALCILSARLFDEQARQMTALGIASRYLPTNSNGQSSQPLPDADIAAPVVIASSLVESYVLSRIEDCEALATDMLAASAGLAMEQARMRGVLFSQDPPSAAVMMTLRRVETALLSQHMQFELDEARARAIRIDRMETHPDSANSGTANAGIQIVKKSPPVLYVRMFGRLEVRLGGERVDEDLIRRQKVKRLFFMLAINQGREISRDRICEHLWPQSNLDIARKNFYNVFSTLKGILTLPDGTCPYLIRRRMSCALGEEYVSTDIMRLDEICREFLFGEPNELAWGELYREIDRDFRDDLLATEVTESYVLAARNDMRTRLVDALTVASQRITESGYPERGIWFARTAIQHDRTREDAYIALMIAQNAARQRGAAILTYMNLRSLLAEELGVDPSPEAQQIYERILMQDGGPIDAAC